VQKYNPIGFRPPEPDRLWLLAYAQRTGRAVNAILAEALARFRADHEDPQEIGR
jgi:hypothetical protein